MLKVGSLPQHLFQYSAMKTYIVVLLVVVVASTLLCRNTDAWMMVVTPFQSTTRQFILNDNSLFTSTLVTTTKSTRTMYHPTKYRNQRTYFMTPSEHPEDTTTTTDRAALNNSNINNNNLNELSPTEFILATENMDPTTRAVVEAAKKKQQQMALITENGGVPSNKYPIDAPSPVLLATSMILAIISTGTCVIVDSRERERNVYHTRTCTHRNVCIFGARRIIISITRYY